MKKKTKGKNVMVRQPQSPQSETIAMIERVARDPNADVDKLEKLLALRDRERAQIAETAFAVSMSRAQTEMEPVRKDCENKQTHSRYASYPALDRAIRPIYSKCGFSLIYNTEPAPEPDVLLVTCDVMHAMGHKIDRQIPIPIVTTGPQGKDVMTKTHATMSAKTYGMRGLLTMIFNIATTDDDGNLAGGKQQPTVLNAEQLKELKLALVGADIKKFYDAFEINDPSELPVSRFKEAMDRIADHKEHKRKKLAEEKV